MRPADLQQGSAQFLLSLAHRQLDIQRQHNRHSKFLSEILDDLVLGSRVLGQQIQDSRMVILDISKGVRMGWRVPSAGCHRL